MKDSQHLAHASARNTYSPSQVRLTVILTVNQSILPFSVKVDGVSILSKEPLVLFQIIKRGKRGAPPLSHEPVSRQVFSFAVELKLS